MDMDDLFPLDFLTPREGEDTRISGCLNKLIAQVALFQKMVKVSTKTSTILPPGETIYALMYKVGR